MVALLEDRSTPTRSTARRRSRSRPAARPRTRVSRTSARSTTVTVARPPEVPVAVVVGVTAVVLVLAVVSLRIVQAPGELGPSLGISSGAEPSGPILPEDLEVAVRPGETMAAIAARLAPGQDPRPIVDALARANGGAEVRVGQRLIIPAPLLVQAMP